MGWHNWVLLSQVISTDLPGILMLSLLKIHEPYSPSFFRFLSTSALSYTFVPFIECRVPLDKAIALLAFSTEGGS